MKKNLTFIFLILGSMVFLSSCSWWNISNPSTSTNTQSGKSQSKLGNLSSFETITKDVASLINKNDLSGWKTRIKDLEVAWDSAEAWLKPRSPSDWHIIDKGIDEALTALRADTPNQGDCKKTITNLLDIFNSMK